MEWELLQPKVFVAGYVLVSGGLHCLHCGPCLGWERSLGFVERALVLVNHPVERLLMGKVNLTDQGMAVGRVQERELVKPTADDEWEEIEGIQHSVIHEVKQG